MRVKNNKLGKRYGKLTVIGELPSKWTGNRMRVQWKCRCDCGKTVIRDADKFRNRSSCGCLPSKPVLPEGRGMGRAVYSGYRKYCEDVGRVFELTFDEFHCLAQQPCHYCGIEKSNSRADARNPDLVYFYNGIDRKDNTQGYILSNCLPCCKKCNYMKRDYGYTEFLVHLKTIVERLQP